MFWIYIPPIILVAALTALIIILGRKSADLKKVKVFQAKAGISETDTGWKSRLKEMGMTVLHLLEKILDFAKVVFRKTEQITSGWAARLRARRNGKNFDETSSGKIFNESDTEVKIIQEIEKTEEISTNLARDGKLEGQIRSDVVVRKKVSEESVIIPKQEPLPEDKVKEAALIYRIAENPKDLEAYRELGDYYMAIGNIKDAKESFKMVLKLRPRDLKAKSSLREIEMRIRLGN